MVAADPGHAVQFIHLAHATLRIRIVADDVAERNIMVDFQLTAFLQNDLQCIVVGVDVTEDCVLCHLFSTSPVLYRKHRGDFAPRFRSAARDRRGKVYLPYPK